MPLDYDQPAKSLIEALQPNADTNDNIWLDAALNAFLKMPPGLATFPSLLRQQPVWDEGTRRALYIWAGDNYSPLSTWAVGPRTQLNFLTLVLDAQAAAIEQCTPVVNEWSIAESLIRRNEQGLQHLRVNVAELRRRIAELSGRAESIQADLAKVWCVCDTNLFIQYEIFNQVDWHKALNLPHVVLVVPTGVVRELDDFKFHYKQKRLRKRARQILPRFDELARDVPPGATAPIRPGVDLLLLSREPRAFPPGLNPALVDDRIIATALEFRWSHPGRRVAVPGRARTTSPARLLPQSPPPSPRRARPPDPHAQRPGQLLSPAPGVL